jgi:hypothetical protein
MIVTVAETTDKVGMTGLNARIGLVERIDQDAKIGHVVKTEVGVMTIKVAEIAVDGKTVHVATIEEVGTTVATNTAITTGIVLNARTPTSLSVQNAIAVASQKTEEEAASAAMIAEIIPVAVIAVTAIVDPNTVTMIGIAPNAKTQISVSVLNAIAVANPKAKVVRNAALVISEKAEEERVAHVVIVGR